eukprot:3419138-Prymnesium_polylepis.2
MGFCGGRIKPYCSVKRGPGRFRLPSRLSCFCERLRVMRGGNRHLLARWDGARAGRPQPRTARHTIYRSPYARSAPSARARP